MSRFERPRFAIEDAKNLKVGDVLWHVYGIWPPIVAGPETVTLAAVPLNNHPKEGGGGGDSIVFDTRHERGFTHMSFASDGNMVPGHSHNDNYWFRSEQDAKDARDYLRRQWTDHPEMIAAEWERREMDREMDFAD